MIRRLLFLTLLLALVGTGRPAAVPDAPAWTNPMGVPTPPVGVTEVAGRTTSRTIPATMHSGDVIDASGNNGDVTVVAECRASRPCFLRNGRFNHLRATGTGLIIEGIQAYNPDLTLDNSALRDSEVTGNAAGGGIFTAGSTYLTVRNVFVHHVGVLDAPSDQDTHCIVVGPSGHHIWVLDSHLTHCSGDGVQVNALHDPQEGLHHIYLARNTIHDNRQSGLWAKQSVDVVMSENRAWGFHPNSGGSGPCYGTQYGSKRLVIIGNRGWECHFGVNLRSSDDGTDPSTLVAWNVFHDLLRSMASPMCREHPNGGAMHAGADEWATCPHREWLRACVCRDSGASGRWASDVHGQYLLPLEGRADCRGRHDADHDGHEPDATDRSPVRGPLGFHVAGGVTRDPAGHGQRGTHRVSCADRTHVSGGPWRGPSWDGAAARSGRVWPGAIAEARMIRKTRR